MNTPAHLLIAAAAFAQPGARARNTAALVGGFLPDASLYGMVAINGLIRGMPPSEIFGRAYFDPFWQGIFAVDNSVFVWGAALIAGLGSGLGALIAFAGSGLLHIATDLPLHHDDGRAHFWPFSDWIFNSPVSYWDRSAYGDVVSLLEVVLCTGLAVILWRRFHGWPARVAVSTALVALLLPSVIFGLML